VSEVGDECVQDSLAVVQAPHLAIERYSNFAGAHIDLAAGG
jgi:hypothetical protein